jgi:hypothetical protein
VGRGAGFVGRLQVTRGVESLGSRQFEDADCAEVVAALALSAALSIDPNARLSAAPDNSVETTSKPDSTKEPSAAPAPETPPIPPAPAPDPQKQDSSGGPGESSEELGKPSEEGGTEWGVGPELAASVAFEPKAAVGFGASLSVHGTPERSWFPLEASLAFNYLSTRATRGNDPVRTDWYVARASYCPLRAGSVWFILACTVGQGGWVTAEGVAISTPRDVGRSLWAAGVGLGTRGSVGGGWQLHAELDITVPLSKRSFAIEPNSVVIASSRPVGASLAVGVRRTF